MSAKDREIGPTRRAFHLTWLTCSPIFSVQRFALVTGVVPVSLAILALIYTLALDERAQGPLLFAGALFFSLAAVLIQSPAFLGRVYLTSDTIEVAGRFLGKASQFDIPRKAIHRVHYEKLTSPPLWVPILWVIFELLCMARAVGAGWGQGSGHWYWLTAVVAGLSLWPLMVARWNARFLILVLFRQPDDNGLGLIRAWATPHQTNSLVNTLLGHIDWEPSSPAYRDDKEDTGSIDPPAALL